MRKLFKLIPFLALLPACTYSISNTMAHTQGEASDVVDETNRTESNIDAKANVPINSPSASSTQATTDVPKYLQDGAKKLQSQLGK